MINPYAPPAHGSAGHARISVFSPGQITWATFLGAPIAGCVLMALNYRRFGDFTSANVALVTGFIGTALLLAIAFFLPENFPNSVLPVAYTFGMYHSAKLLQGTAYEQHLANGGVKASGWAATGVGILSLLCITVAIFAVVLVMPAEWLGEEL
jgi:hypothetical protein